MVSQESNSFQQRTPPSPGTCTSGSLSPLHVRHPISNNPSEQNTLGRHRLQNTSFIPIRSPESSSEARQYLHSAIQCRRRNVDDISSHLTHPLSNELDMLFLFQTEMSSQRNIEQVSQASDDDLELSNDDLESPVRRIKLRPRSSSFDSETSLLSGTYCSTQPTAWNPDVDEIPFDQTPLHIEASHIDDICISNSFGPLHDISQKGTCVSPYSNFDDFDNETSLETSEVLQKRKTLSSATQKHAKKVLPYGHICIPRLQFESYSAPCMLAKPKIEKTYSVPLPPRRKRSIEMIEKHDRHSMSFPAKLRLSF